MNNLDSEVQKKRDFFDGMRADYNPILEDNGFTSIAELEQSWKLERIYANLPYPEGMEIIVEEYVSRMDNQEIEDFLFLPGWWSQTTMSRIIEKGLLPFAIYVKR
jgi:hypothetical protein